MPPRNPDRVRARGERTDPRAQKIRGLTRRAEDHEDPALRAMFRRMARWARDPHGEARRAHVEQARQTLAEERIAKSAEASP